MHLRNVCAQGRRLPARPAPEGSVSPVGCCAKRKATRRCAGGKRQPCGLLRKATRRREQIQGLRAASAQNADICEGAKRAEGAASVLRED